MRGGLLDRDECARGALDAGGEHHVALVVLLAGVDGHDVSEYEVVELQRFRLLDLKEAFSKHGQLRHGESLPAVAGRTS